MQTILCPTDFSPASENATRYADQLALWAQARLVLLHNIHEPVAPDVKSFGGVMYAEPIRDPGLRQRQLDQLEALKARLSGAGGSRPVDYQTQLCYGQTHANIAAEARNSQASLVVVASKRHEAWKQLFQGSVLPDVIRQAPCPVLIVPPDATFRPYSKIVFASSLLEEESGDLHLVSELASLFQATILFLHILTEFSLKERRQAEAVFLRFRQKLPGANTTLFIETHDQISEGITRFTTQAQADLLVMGHHSYNFWESLFIEDFTQSVVRHSNLPLLVIHH
ncbi:MAG: universal stress protein [Adhaeribacter sp.]